MRVPPFALFLLFTLVPLLEVWLLVQVGRWLGFWPTLALVVGTGFLGASLARREGTRVLTQWHEATSRGELPKEGLVSGLLVLLGGILLITPGVLTDLAGLALLFPPTRRLVATRVQRRLEQRFTLAGPGMGSPFVGGATFSGFPGFPGQDFPGRDFAGSGFIDVEATTVPEEAPSDEAPAASEPRPRADAQSARTSSPRREPAAVKLAKTADARPALAFVHAEIIEVQAGKPDIRPSIRGRDLSES